MKINIIPTIISIMTAALLAFLFYTLSSAEGLLLKAIAISGFVSTALCLEFAIGMTFKDSQHKVNGCAVSLLFFIALIVEHCCFAIWGSSLELLIITTGLITVSYLMILYGISKAKM